ncbi:SRPBCC family protein [Streptomyces sp. NPDC005356]|uniref:SRPBCC family protein n=1 Tax=unclassified Streptomyces TaxID=2593676 RepID=UPI0033B8E1E0
MELTNTFTVGMPVEDTWKALTDLERIAPCLPGAALLGKDGEDYQGAVKIKVGPVSATYKGTARFLKCDDAAHRAVIRAEGSDAGGQGNAAATITVDLSPQGDGTRADVRTDLALSGRVAQFGRGVISDVSNKMMKEFVNRLENEVASGGGARPAAPGTGAPAAASAPAARPSSLDDLEPLDVVGSMGGLIAKRALPVLGAVAVAVVGVVLLRRGRGRPPAARSGGWDAAAGVVPVVINLTLPTVVRRPSTEELELP